MQGSLCCIRRSSCGVSSCSNSCGIASTKTCSSGHVVVVVVIAVVEVIVGVVVAISLY